MVIFLIDPGEEGLIELIQGLDMGSLHFCDKVIDTETVEGLYFAMPFGSVGFCMDGSMDAQFSTEDLHVFGLKDHGIIIVYAGGFSVALQGPFKDQFKCRQIPFEEKATVKEEAGGVIKEGVKIRYGHSGHP